MGFFESLTLDELESLLDREDYVADRRTVVPVYLSLTMGKPLLLEGEPGSGKTELGKVLARALDTRLIRLQCYEGLTLEQALYEWNYTRQLLTIQAGEASVDTGSESVFSEEYLQERPLLEALRHEGDNPPVLLIDEVDRSDPAFEAFLLEFLSDFQVSIPELGTVTARNRPVVVLTSNRTRALSDALKRRCLYLYLELPDRTKEKAVIDRKVGGLSEDRLEAMCRVASVLRDRALLKRPGLAEMIDWGEALKALSPANGDDLTREELEQTLGCLLKEAEDVSTIEDELEDVLIEASQLDTGDEASS